MYDDTKPLVDNDKKTGLIGKFCKLIGSLLILLIVLVLASSIFIRFYLTDARLKELILPPTEAALGRSVAVGSIDVGLFSGITINNLIIKEADKSSDFLAMNRFVLHYDLFPLLQKKLVISEVVVDQPSCRITRDQTGHFNFESLAILADKPAPAKEPASTPTSPTSLPLALTVDRITINKAHISVHDAMQELPEIDATATADITVAMGANLADLKFKGDFDFTADISHGQIKPKLQGKGSFDNRRATCKLLIDIDQQHLNIVAKAKNLLAKPLPPLQLDISSDKLNIDQLLALAEKLPPTSNPQKTGAKQTTKKDTPIAAALPPGLDLTGSIKVDEILYQKLTVDDLALAYTLKNGVADVSNLSFKTAGGKFVGKTQIDLTKSNPAYHGTLDIAALQIQELLASLVSPQANILSGGMAAGLKFSGTGLSADLLKKHLNLDATYGMQGAKISETPISTTLANVLKLEQLRNLTLNNVDGNLHLRKGQLQLRSLLKGAGIKVQTDGNVDINDGKLDLPLSFEFSGAVAKQLQEKASFLKYLADKNGATTLNLKLTGTTNSPRAILNQAAVEKQIKEKALKEIGKQLLGNQSGGGEKKPAEQAQKLFKGFFGN